MYQALYSSLGASHAILTLARAAKIQLAISVPVFQEYSDVLLRRQSLLDFGLTRQEVGAVLDFIAFVAIPTDIHYLWRPNLSDEADNAFVELAFASNSSFLITSNIRDFKQAQLKFDGFRVVTPADFLRLWRKDHA